MVRLTLELYVRSLKITTSSVDLDSVGHQCANPMRTGAYDRMGSEAILLDEAQSLLLDATKRACSKMKWQLVIVDVAAFSFLDRIRLKGTTPRLEAKGKIMVGTPNSDEIIQFFMDDDEDWTEKILDINQSKRVVEIS